MDILLVFETDIKDFLGNVVISLESDMSLNEELKIFVDNVLYGD